jgi:hypothetical protein
VSQTNDSAVVRELAERFERNGYVRRQNPDRVAEEGPARYKKGDEVRLVAASEADLRHLRELLEAVGFKPGNPYAQAGRFRQPLYGRREVARFLEMIGVSPPESV